MLFLMEQSDQALQCLLRNFYFSFKAVDYLTVVFIYIYIYLYNFITFSVVSDIPYFLGYKTDFFSFQNNPKDLDLSYKTDLDL